MFTDVYSCPAPEENVAFEASTTHGIGCCECYSAATSARTYARVTGSSIGVYDTDGHQAVMSRTSEVSA